MNSANKSVIHEKSLGSFTRRKAGIWDILFYFPSEGRHTEDFPNGLRPGLNPRTRVPVASMLTTRPPKSSHIGRRFGVLLLVGTGSGLYVPCCLACEFETKRWACHVT